MLFIGYRVFDAVTQNDLSKRIFEEGTAGVGVQRHRGPPGRHRPEERGHELHLVPQEERDNPEDDCDGEYRYAGRPLPALHGLDSENRTLYLGTLSKTLFPSLRLGYLVVPAA